MGNSLTGFLTHFFTFDMMNDCWCLEFFVFMNSSTVNQYAIGDCCVQFEFIAAFKSVNTARLKMNTNFVTGESLPFEILIFMLGSNFRIPKLTFCNSGTASFKPTTFQSESFNFGNLSKAIRIVSTGI